MTTPEKRAAWRKHKKTQRDRLRKAIAEILPNHCIRCNRDAGPSVKLEFAHIKPTNLSGRARGSIEALKDILANPDCYTRLCVDCHRRFDAGKVELELPEAPF